MLFVGNISKTPSEVGFEKFVACDKSNIIVCSLRAKSGNIVLILWFSFVLCKRMILLQQCL